MHFLLPDINKIRCILDITTFKLITLINYYFFSQFPGLFQHWKNGVKFPHFARCVETRQTGFYSYLCIPFRVFGNRMHIKSIVFHILLHKMCIYTQH